MKIYFAGSISGGRGDTEIYLQIITLLKQYGEVFTEHVGDKNLRIEHDRACYIHTRDLDWLLQSDVIVAEVSIPSLGVGYELGRAVENKKKVLCLYRSHSEKKLSCMISGCPNIINKEYQTTAEVKNILEAVFGQK